AASRGAAPTTSPSPSPGAVDLAIDEPLVARTDRPAFPTSSVDGFAVRGAGPWRLTGRVLAGQPADPLGADGTCVEIATGAMVPAGTTAIVRGEGATVTDGLVRGEPRDRPGGRQ